MIRRSHLSHLSRQSLHIAGLSAACAFALSAPASAQWWGSNVSGSGKIVTETRPISNIQKLDVSTMGKVELIQGDKESLEISADDNIMPLIESTVRSGTLQITNSRNFSSKDVKVTIHIKSLDRLAASGVTLLNANQLTTKKLDIEASGASQVRIDALQAEQLIADLSGASRVRLAGNAKELSYEASGAASLYGSSLRVDSMKGQGSGASRVTLYANKRAESSLSGASSLDLTGNVEMLNASFGGTSVVNANELIADKITVNGSGSARATVRANKEITGEMSGASRLKHYGAALPVVSRTGVAKVTKGE
jgi:hypothetical protein